MNFLNGALLPGLVFLAGVPLLIHLLNLRFPRLFEFSSVKHIRETIAQRSRIFSLATSVADAFAHGVCGVAVAGFFEAVAPTLLISTAEQRAARAGADRDRPLARHGTPGRRLEQPATRGDEAEKILATLGAEDSVNIITAGQAAQSCFFELSHNLAEARQYLSSIKPAYGRADFSQANGAAARLLAQATSRAGDLLFVELRAAELGERGLYGAAAKCADVLCRLCRAGRLTTTGRSSGRHSEARRRCWPRTAR